MDECPFCKIVRKELEAEVVHEDEHVMAFWDKNPRAPVHVNVIPKRHVRSLARVRELPDPVLRRFLETPQEVAERLGFADSGYVVKINTGPDAGQDVFHLHAHVVGGRKIRPLQTW